MTTSAGGGEPGKASGKIRASGPDRLTDQGGGGRSDAESRQIADSLGGNREGIRRQGNRAERCDDSCADDLSDRKGHMLKSHRNGNADSLFQGFRLDAPGAGIAEVQNIGFHTGFIGEKGTGKKICACRAQGRSHNAESRSRQDKRAAEQGDGSGRKDQEEIEYHIAEAAQYSEHARNFHIAGALQRGKKQIIELPYGKKQRVNEKILRGIVPNGGIGAKPGGKTEGGADCEKTEQQGKGKGSENRLPEDIPRQSSVAGTGGVSDLYGKAVCACQKQISDKPGGRSDKPDRGGCPGAHGTDHRGIDILHDDFGNHRKHRGKGQPNNSFDSFCQRH